MSKRILIVEDDEKINSMIRLLLCKNGYEAVSAYSGSEGLLAHNNDTDLILLDLMLPGLRGEEVIKDLKKKHDVPVIVLSAISDVSKKVDMFSLGADDYITKPFDNDELLARIAARLRTRPLSDDKSEISYKGLKLDAESGQVFADEKPVKLTRTEFAILKILVLNAEHVVPKLTILERICEDTPDCTEDSLKIHVHNMRKKLKAVTDTEYIEAIWGIGFMVRS